MLKQQLFDFVRFRIIDRRFAFLVFDIGRCTAIEKKSHDLYVVETNGPV